MRSGRSQERNLINSLLFQPHTYRLNSYKQPMVQSMAYIHVKSYRISQAIKQTCTLHDGVVEVSKPSNELM
jgi:hypothetical protein